MTRILPMPIFSLRADIATNFSTIGFTLPGLQYMISRINSIGSPCLVFGNEGSNHPSGGKVHSMMRHTVVVIVATCLAASHSVVDAQPARSGNPILPGWYADPEAHVFDGQ